MENTSDKSHIHITPLKTYIVVACALIILTGITVGVSLIHLSGWNAVVAILIASIKATLVGLFFMHLLYDKKIYLVIVMVAVTVVFIFLTLTMFDTVRRGDLYQIKSAPIEQQSKMYNKSGQDTTGTIQQK